MTIRFPSLPASLGLALAFAAISLPSCAVDSPPVEEEEQLSEPRSKPVKMPPTVRKLGNIEGIEIDELFQLQQAGNVLIYDVRNPYFYGIGHIPGAINWPHTKYDAQVQKRDIEIQKALNADKKVVLYCFNPGCPEARNVAKKLARRDYEVYVFGAGTDAWKEAGLPFETAGKAPAN